MCGFLGWFKAKPDPWQEYESAHSASALKRLRHRGPDDAGMAAGAGWWMGFQRLAILDLSPAGHQPMSFGAGRFTLTFNGEIYNFRDLISETEGYERRSTGDTEVLGALLSRKPVDRVLNQLRGMFAFAWWDAEERSLVVARDAFGIKPLYYRQNAEGDLFIGSEMRALRHLAKARLTLSQRALAQYLRWGSVQAPDTMIEGIECLPPGHLLRWRDGQLRIERWFVPTWPGADGWEKHHARQVDAVRESILGSVQAHLVSDVPVGVFLSGGLDSTLMAACMRHLGQSDVHAFSIGYEENAGVPDESDTAARTAEFLGCRFTRERITAGGLLSRLDDYINSLDQPTGDALNTWLVSRLAAQHVKVTLSGLGADEWFAGYNYHRLAQLARLSPFTHVALGRVTGAASRLIDSLLPQRARGHKAWKALLHASGGAGQTAAEMHALARTIITPPHVARLLGLPPGEAHRWTEDNPLRSTLLAHLDDRAPDSWLQQLLMIETETYLANTLLRDNDCTSMAHSLELRVPLVDRQIFDLAGRIPPGAKLSLSKGKKVIREAFRHLLPPWINDDTQKKTFTLPLMKWMRTPGWREGIMDTLGSDALAVCDTKEARRLVERYYADSTETKAAWHLSQPVWLLFVLSRWLRAQV